MTFTITQDRQLASLTVTKEEKEILFAVKSKAGEDSLYVFVMVATIKAGFIVIE
ncbi:hypothetical protein [Escherichia coli]|uniref:hypothetical protein n=1 Tax=Escherichia coli TaxID=562 RepID=UPI00201DB992|nr:hypothetical protein [Escherichia coli]